MGKERRVARISTGKARLCELDEYELMRAIQNRDEHAFEELIRRYEINLTRFVLGLVGDESAVEEIVSDIFMRIWKYAKTWREGAGSTWIFKIARNRVRDEFRRANPLQAAVPLEHVPEPQDSGNPRSNAISAEEQQLIKSCIDSLGPLQEIFELRFFWKVPTKLMARQLGKTTQEVDYALRKATKLLRKCVEEKLSLTPSATREDTKPNAINK